MANYDYYKIFYYVAQYRSFTKAAEILGNNQPNITRCMNNLENELNCKLFVRSNRGVTLTPEGRKLYEHVAVACEQIQAGEQELRKNSGLESGLITIGTSETALRLLLLDKLEAFHEKYPQVRLRISNHSSPQAISVLESGLVDFAVVTSPVTAQKSLRKIPLYTFREILIGGLKYAELASGLRSLGDLADLPFISLGNGTSSKALYIQYFLDNNLPFRPDIEVATTDQVLPMVAHNLGLGFYPEDLAAEALTRGEILRIPLREPLPARQVYLIQDTARPVSIAAGKLMDSLLSDSASKNGGRS
ncbi:MAG: LysR family transcriptional regulator [Eubacteriales bacterium]|nr:LysR family transcriptional regulator [Eubacteriales bacterium]